MRTLLLAPHSDDEILFAAYTIARYQPDVYIVARDPDPDVAIRRGSESIKAITTMGHDQCTVDYLGEQTEGNVSAMRLWDDLDRLRTQVDYARVFAPAVEEHGHGEHNLVGEVASMMFGDLVTPYLTYTRTHGRSTLGDEVFYETEWISRKLRALAEYGSQIAHPARRPWFYDLIDLREWYA